MASGLRILFVTNPLCSWCWGMAAEIERVRKQLGIPCDFLCGRLGDSGAQPLGEGALSRFVPLWKRVAEVTGQEFSYRLPEGFRYDSEPVCRALLAAREVLGQPPFAYLLALQRAFFVEARDLGSRDQQLALAEECGLEVEGFARSLEDPGLSEKMHEEFESARSCGARALPSVVIEEGRKRRLFAGGYVSGEYLLAELATYELPPD